MGKFLQTEKPKQVAFKQTSATISNAAKAEGIYKDHAYPFCLPRELAKRIFIPQSAPPFENISVEIKSSGTMVTTGIPVTICAIPRSAAPTSSFRSRINLKPSLLC